MKLSTLVHYRNLLEKYKPRDMNVIVDEHVGHVRHIIKEHEIQFPNLLQQLDTDYQKIHLSFKNFSQTIGKIEEEIDHLIGMIEPEYFSQSYKLYDQFLSRDESGYILNRRLSLTEETTVYIRGRIRIYSDWHYPGLIIRPGLENWIEDLVACDPLYLVDRDIEILKPALEKFNPDYQRRLRLHVLRPTDDGGILDGLPHAQIGFCLIYNFFNFTPFEILRIYLEEIFQKLKNGGTVAFTFNNCDHAGAVKLVEQNFMCYTPGKLLLALCESLGFEITQTYQMDAACTWVEMKKPGILSSLRGGQNLARIVAKSK